MYFKYFEKRFIENKSLIYILSTYSILCLITSIICFVNLSVRNGIVSLLFMLFPILVYPFEKIFKINISSFIVFLVYIIALGGLFGTCFDLYVIIPYFDTVLHCLAGFTFACVGFLIFSRYIGKIESKAKFWLCIFASICFSLSIEFVWEIFEYLTSFLGFDMLEDTIIYNFDSYLLSGSHNIAFNVHDISETIIYYGNGDSLIIKGYLDIGLIDTLHDMIICVIGTIVFLITFKLNPEIKKIYSKL